MDVTRQALLHAMQQHDLDVMFRADNPEAWAHAWEGVPFQKVSHAALMIDYQHAYLRSTGCSVHDLCLVIRHDAQPSGIWPLTVTVVGDQVRLSSTGSAILAPIFVSTLSPRTVRRMMTRAVSALRLFAASLRVAEIHLAGDEPPDQHDHGVGDWHLALMEAGAHPKLRHVMYTDLRSDLAEIRSSFRKSFRPLINAGLRAWTAGIPSLHEVQAQCWSEFKQLHKDVAGRVTRDDLTWEHQLNAICKGQAFLVCLRNPRTDKMVGAGYFHCTRDEGLYAVAAYDRNLFDKPLGHVVQQLAIEQMKARGLRWYRIGDMPFAQDTPAVTEKQLSIGAFKSGFASHLECRIEFKIATTTALDTGASPQ